MGSPQHAIADVIVLSNRNQKAVRVFLPEGTTPANLTRQLIAPGAVVPLYSIGPLEMSYETPDGPVRARLDASGVYVFDMTSDSRLILQQTALGGDSRSAGGTGVASAKTLLQVVEVPVKILVDDDEPATQTIWEERLRKRIASASNILERTCLIRLKVVAVESWKSNNEIADFDRALTEFTSAVDPHPARLAIGFTSQFEIPEHPSHVGGSSGLLRGHILLREKSRTMTEAERTEALLHELGHIFGAVHSNSGLSLMRPELADGRAREARFPQQFDPVNLLVMNLMAEEVRLRDAKSLRDLTPETRRRLKQVYTELGLAPQKTPEEDPEPKDEVASTAPSATGETIPTEEPATADAPVADAAHPTLALMQGRWKVTQASRRQEKVGEALAYAVTLKGNQVTVEAKGLGTFRFRMDLAPTGSAADNTDGPIPFNLVMDVKGKEYVSQGIMQLVGEELRACCAMPGKPRPKEFAAGKEGHEANLVFRRDVP